MKKVKIKYVQSGNQLLVSKEFFEHYNLNTSLQLKLGSWSAEVVVTPDPQIEDTTLGISKELLPFDLPETLPYEINIEDHTLHLGPIIGILNSSKSSNTLGTSKRKVLKSRLKNFEDINGLIYVFSLEDLNFEDKLIKGHYFLPTNKEDRVWVEGTFPFPDSIYNRIRLNHKIRKSIIEITGNTLFNSTQFDKYKLWKVCSTDSLASQYVPDSMPYTEPNDFFEMINKHSHIYIKPIRGMQGKGITVAKKEKGSITFQTSNGHKTVCHFIEEIAYYLGKNLSNKHGYILQQGIDSLYKDKKVDFRFYFQKNPQKEWVCQGVVGRIATKDSVVTNYKYLSKLLTGKKAVRRLFKVNKNEANGIINSTIEKCKIVCNLIDEQIGHYGDLAIDVIIDKNKHPYILEINNRVYGTKSLKKLKKKKLFKKIRTTPIAYAKSLAGF
ncbi:YheC/YheD family endospore coat-associated protein [Bacillus sp. AK128]